MQIILFALFVFGIPWALPKLFPQGYTLAGIALCITSVVILFVVAGTKEAYSYQAIATGVVIGSFLACRKGWIANKGGNK